MIFMLFKCKKYSENKIFFAYLLTLKNIQMFPETRHLLFFFLIETQDKDYFYIHVLRSLR